MKLRDKYLKVQFIIHIHVKTIQPLIFQGQILNCSHVNGHSAGFDSDLIFPTILSFTSLMCAHSVSSRHCLGQAI